MTSLLLALCVECCVVWGLNVISWPQISFVRSAGPPAETVQRCAIALWMWIRLKRWIKRWKLSWVVRGINISGHPQRNWVDDPLMVPKYIVTTWNLGPSRWWDIYKMAKDSRAVPTNNTAKHKRGGTIRRESKRDHASSPNDKSFLSVFFGFFFTGFELLSLTISPNEAKSSSCSCKSTTPFRFLLAADPAVLEPADEKFRPFEFVVFGLVVVEAGSMFGLSEGSGRGGRP